MELVKKNVETLEKMFESHDDISEYYVSKSKIAKLVKIVNLRKQVGYIFNTTTKLYEQFDTTMLYTDLRKIVSEAILEVEKAIDKIDVDVLNKTKSKQLENYKKFLKKQKNTLETSSKFDSVLKCCCPRLYDNKFMTKLNSYGDVLPIKDGRLIDLRTLEVRQRTPEDYFTEEMDVDYVKGHFKNIEKIMSQICTGNKVKVQFLSYILGASITVDMSMKSFFLFFGSGDNGKSLLLNQMAYVFKPFACSIPTELLFSEDANKIKDTSYGYISGKRLGIYSEPSKNRLCEPSVKKITGSDTLEGRTLYCGKYDFSSCLKILLASNELVYFNTKSIAMMSRLKVINFDSVFKSKPNKDNRNEYKKDVDLAEKLKTVYKNEFFSYIVTYASKYLNSKNRDKLLEQPKELIDEKTNYIVKIEKLASFIKDRCENCKDGFLPRSIFKRSFHKYLSDRNQFKPNDVDTFEDMKKRYTLVKRNGIWGYTGITLKKNEEDDDDDDDVEEIETNDYEYGIEKKSDDILTLREQLQNMMKRINELETKQIKDVKIEPIEEAPTKKAIKKAVKIEPIEEAPKKKAIKKDVKIEPIEEAPKKKAIKKAVEADNPFTIHL